MLVLVFMYVLIGNNFDISISTNTRRTESFDILVSVLVLMSRLSSLAHKHLVLVFVLVSLVRNNLDECHKCGILLTDLSDHLPMFQITSSLEKVNSTHCDTKYRLINKTTVDRLKGQYHAIFSNTLKIEKTLFG